ncbi:Transcriptional regulator GlxA family, contains an amidase domain and an AraC-type DNA-binding HTH domain [Variovorax sp. 770b2]|nr:Transcriptional regulator GlxA family, contains an amidase domain and an AraC-type DNA-binding HTH domain [Variovorax sp. 770b2]
MQNGSRSSRKLDSSRTEPRWALNAPGPTREIGLVVFEDVLLLDVAGPADVFSRANAHLKVAGHPDRYRVTSISSYGGEVGASAGLRMQTAALPNPSICAFDTLLVAGGPGVLSARHDLLLRNWLLAVEPRVRRIGSVCTGAFILAESGLLTDKPATTHWNHAASFAELYPQVRLNIDAMYVREGKMFSSAGATAGIDLALHLVDEDFGRELALAIARELVVFRVRSAGQAQYSAALASYGGESDRMRRATEFILSRLHERVSVEDVAAHVCLGVRQLSRLFANTLGISPIQYIGAAQVDLARELLSGTQQPLEKIALRCGFSGRQHFARVFSKNVGVSPNDFRARFHP